MGANKEAQNLDNQFVKILTNIQQAYLHFSKHIQIRIQKWIVKLIEADETLYWKKSRNNYLKLLFFMIKQKNIEEPFTTIPLQTDLPYLSDYELSVKTKSTFHGNINSYFQTKPQIFKIVQPNGDDSSLISLGRTDRSDFPTEEKQILEELKNINNFSFKNIKQSKLIQYKQSEIFLSLRNSNFSSKCTISKNNIGNNQTKIQQKKNKPSFYSSKNSSQLKMFQNKQKLKKCQKNIQQGSYKQIALMMASILLKNQFLLQKQEQYWTILKSIRNFCGTQFQEMQKQLEKVKNINQRQIINNTNNIVKITKGSNVNNKNRETQQSIPQLQFQPKTENSICRIQQSVDFLIQEGIQPSKALIFQLQNCENYGCASNTLYFANDSKVKV